MPTNKRETQIIMKHVLEDEEHLGVALDIISRTQEIREEIIKTFLKELKSFICKGFICKKLDMSQWNWETGLRDNPYGKKENKHRDLGVYSKFGVLQEPIFISLRSNNTKVNDFYIGIISYTTNGFCNESMNHLSCRLNKVCGPGKSWEQEGEPEIWIWYQPLSFFNRDYADWENKDTLIKMYTEEAIQDIGNPLLRIIEVAKPEIEKWVEQNPPTP